MSASAQILKEIEGFDFYRPFFDEEIYEDGRGLDEDRPFAIKNGLDRNAVGSSYVQWQGSTVSCRITAKAGHVDNERCARIKLERSNSVPKREFDFVRGVIHQLVAQNAFVHPKSTIFDVEYQIQLKITLTINTSDGFLLGALLIAINSALASTRVAEMSSQPPESDDPTDKIRFSRKRNPFYPNLEKLQPVKVEDRLFYTGVLVVELGEGKEPLLLCDPPEDLVRSVRKRVDLILGADDTIYFWQNSGFVDGMSAEFRRKIFALARERRDAAAEVLAKVEADGQAASDE